MPGGSPTKLTPTLYEELRKLLRKGYPRVVVANSLGIAVSTLNEWLAGEHIDAELSEGLRKADAEFVQTLHDSVWDAGYEAGADNKRAFQAHAWLLERRHPRDYGRTDRVEHGGAIATKDFSADDELRLAASIVEAKARRGE